MRHSSYIFAPVYRVGVILVCLMFSNMASAGAFERLFAPSAELWPLWQKHDASSTQEIDHSLWNSFLTKYVATGSDGISRVSYKDVSEDDKRALNRYIVASESIAIAEFNKSQQLAYWVNLYNAVTVNIILAHYPVQSIRDIDISPGFFADGPWGKKVLSIAGETVSLNDIEHRILRPIWKDPRLHYVLNCASLGCPNLRDRVYTASDMDNAMDMAARDYVNHKRAVSVEGENVNVSSIYSWFLDDFGATEKMAIEHFQQYAAPELAKSLNNIEFFNDDSYDWSLNDAAANF